jgi:hypothetical protein
MASITWEHSYHTAMDRAKREGKPVLLDFFSPG